MHAHDTSYFGAFDDDDDTHDLGRSWTDKLYVEQTLGFFLDLRDDGSAV
jgi:hypothetical protein